MFYLQSDFKMRPKFLFLYCVVMMLANTLTASSVKPHIVMIVADDLGFDDVSFRGSREFLTPNIDALAYHGKILDRLYAPALCTPSRAALLTGKYPINTGMQHFVISNEEPWSLPTNVTTMAQLFQRAGYSTNLVGKWHLGFARKEQTPTYRGFDYHYGFWGSYIDYYQRRAKMPVPNFNLGYDFRRNMKLECGERGTYVTDLLTTEAERIILTNNGSRPLLLMVSHLATHTGSFEEPLQAPSEEVAKFSYIKSPQRRTFAAMVSRLDQSVGRIVRALERADMLSNAIVIFQSDNGAPSVGMFENTGSNWPLRGQKNTPWEGGVRVAGAIWSPKLSERGNIFRQPMYVGDWLPTLAAAADLAPDSKIDGINLWPALTTATEPIEREIVHSLDDIWHVVSYMRSSWKYVNGTTLAGVNDKVLTYREEYDVDPREERYVVEVRNSLASKALRQYDEKRLNMRRIISLRGEAAVKCGNLQRACNSLLEECLYNLEADPCEQNNLVWEREHREVLQGMREQVEKFRRQAWPAGNRAGAPEYDPTRHACTWSNFLEEPASEAPLDCDYNETPCDAAT